MKTLTKFAVAGFLTYKIVSCDPAQYKEQRDAEVTRNIAHPQKYLHNPETGESLYAPKDIQVVQIDNNNTSATYRLFVTKQGVLAYRMPCSFMEHVQPGSNEAKTLEEKLKIQLR